MTRTKLKSKLKIGIPHHTLESMRSAYRDPVSVEAGLNCDFWKRCTDSFVFILRDKVAPFLGRTGYLREIGFRILVGLSAFLITIEFRATGNDDVSRGERLARQYCVACHEFTEPELLTKKSWNFLLTYMGLRMGIEDDSYLIDPDAVEKATLDARRTSLSLMDRIPDHPVLQNEEWELIRGYFDHLAPERAILPKNKPQSDGVIDLFSEKKHAYQVNSAVTSMVFIDEAKKQLLVGDSRNQVLTVLDSDLGHMSTSKPLNYTFWVDAVPGDGGLYLLSIGDLFAYFGGRRLGSVSHIERIGFLYLGKERVLDNLFRPADMEFADMDGDGVDELLVCNYGIEGGDFSIYGRNGKGLAFDPIPTVTLFEDSGAIKCDTHDFNRDGLKDIVLLVSDFKEQLVLFINKGNNEYEPRPVFETHPSWGSVSFQLVDMNGDGLVDIVTTNGDSPDSDPYNTLKAYHGIRIYQNDGKLGFGESYFYPMYGCYQIEAHDYDRDGDVDIAACAFYPNFDAETPENFVYLEQTENMRFSPKHHPATQEGRWMTMDAGDLDQDGDIDIALGATYIPVGLPTSQMEFFEEKLEKGPTLLFLENKVLE